MGLRTHTAVRTAQAGHMDATTTLLGAKPNPPAAGRKKKQNPTTVLYI